MERTYSDHNGQPLNVGDRVEYFSVINGPSGGDALGWQGGDSGTVAELGGTGYPAGMVLVEMDKGTQYPAPHDKVRVWADGYRVVKTA
ncbi:hypothetical protein ACFY04_25780 [Streptomyces sp. NPDC001549]|uniref:hypothetical protein n=1 Tax=Streptomyces sp. NPDC001549 TaxID=3364586 RepID=UPI00368B1DBE